MKTFTSITIASALTLAGAAQAQVVHTASGADAASILPTVDAYRAVLGTLNANSPGSLCSVRSGVGVLPTIPSFNPNVPPCSPVVLRSRPSR